MTNTNMLRKKISECGITFTFLASRIGITREALYMKLRNETEFKASEIVKVVDALGLTDKERNEIFFAKMVN